MWSKQSTGTEAVGVSPQQTPAKTTATTPGSSPVTSPVATPAETQTSGFNALSLSPTSRSGGSGSGVAGRLGASFKIKGSIAGGEDLQIDGTVEGPISLNGHELTVGPTAQLTSEIHAGEVIVYGKVIGNVHSKGRVDIKKDGSLTGDVDSARISIEDGAYFKGSIEIDPMKAKKASA